VLDLRNRRCRSGLENQTRAAAMAYAEIQGTEWQASWQLGKASGLPRIQLFRQSLGSASMRHGVFPSSDSHRRPQAAGSTAAQ